MENKNEKIKPLTQDQLKLLFKVLVKDPLLSGNDILRIQDNLKKIGLIKTTDTQPKSI